MKRLILKFLIYLVIGFGLINEIQSSLSHGSSCLLNNGLIGICVDISSCQQLKTLLAERKVNRDDITICNEALRYLCCPFPTSEGEITTGTTSEAVSSQETTTLTYEKIISTETTTKISTSTESNFMEKSETGMMSH